ncbi:MAG: threonylcarbamoyl-AMP synthase [Chloroflexi bacterium]|nr:threonylcarbamoyl-AMP synthase [Chloroflexota bacterium]
MVTEAVSLVRQGGVVAYPTDTVYGLGADAFNEAAIEKVFAIKGRPLGMPLPLLLASAEELGQVTSETPPLVASLAARFWPGALTLVLPKGPRVPAALASRGWTVGVRVPDHPVPRELVRRLGSPITGTSANRSGGPEATTEEDVRRQLGGLVDLIIVGGPRPRGVTSTVLDLTGPAPRIVRAGAIPKEALEEVCGHPLSAAPVVEERG